jgi:hypothetical protein
MSISFSKKKLARLAGFIYLGVVLTGLFSLMYIPSKLIVSNNAALTYQNIISSEQLFRLGIVSGLACYTFFLFLPLVLYKLLKQVNENYAKIMVLLAVVSVPMSFINIQNKFTVLSLISSPDYLKVFSTDQLQSQILFYLHEFNYGVKIVSIFWGLWLFPFGYLVFKSGFLPKFLGICLMTGCFGYLTNFIGSSLYQDYGDLGIARFISLPASIGEIGICLWLLIVGVKQKSTP